MAPISCAACDICGEGLSAANPQFQAQLCTPCQNTRPHFAKATAYGAYDGELRDLIHLLKYEQVASAVNVLGRMLAEAMQKLELNPGLVLVIPVPLHRSKRRERGFNQAESIARVALKRNDFSKLQLATDVLERTRFTVSQIGLSRSQRTENVRGAFRVVHLKRVEGRQVLLVDDVMTTGTTANECARVLCKAGAEKVWVATVARTLKENAASFGVTPELRKKSRSEDSAIRAVRAS